MIITARAKTEPRNAKIMRPKLTQTDRHFARMAADFLQAWGDYQNLTGSASYSPEGLENDQTVTKADTLSSKAAYVEDTPGFHLAQLVLTMVYGRGQSFDSRYEPEAHRQFRENLEERLEREPWMAPGDGYALCHMDEVERAARLGTQYAEEKFPDRFKRS